MGMTIVLTGNPVDGMTAYGPFTTRDDALEWASHECSGDWWLMPLAAPDAEA